MCSSDLFKHRVATEDVSNYKVVRKGQLVYNPYVLWEGAIHTLQTPAAGLVSPVYPVWQAHDVDAVYLRGRSASSRISLRYIEVRGTSEVGMAHRSSRSRWYASSANFGR